jgi:TatD DNase family protein
MLHVHESVQSLDMIDALCHLELMPPDERERALAQARKAGVTTVISAGVDPLTDEGVGEHRAFGIHPEYIDDLDAQLRALENKIDGAIALGECGIDLRPNMPPLALQLRALEAQLALARAKKKPVIFHLVRSHAKLWPILDSGPPIRGVWHGFSGPKEAVREAVNRGLYISVGALVLKANARKLREAVPHIPHDRLLVETDTPDVPMTMLVDVVKEVARLRGTSMENIVASTVTNATVVFGI